MRPNNEENRLIGMMMLIILLALATQLCTAQLAHGRERFLTAARGADVELRGAATVIGNEIRFRQIARWADADKTTFDPIADLIVTRFGQGEAFRKIDLADVKRLLGEAGVNVAPMNFVGGISCTVTRSDVAVPEGEALEQWHAAKTQATVDRDPALSAKTEDSKTMLLPTRNPTPLAPSRGKADDILAASPAFADAKAQPADSASRSLRDALTQQIAEKLNLPIESLQITFRPQEEKLLRLSEPQFRFGIEPQRTGNLGNVSWSITITSDKGTTRVFVPAEVKAWQDQLVIARPLSTKQLITAADVVERRTLVDRLGDDALLGRQQTVGQMASRELKPGAVVTAHMVDAVQLVRTGQFVTIETLSGGVRLKIVGKALDPGTLGQIVRVRNESTREVMQATVTGPQTASLAG
jgi:flagella basal body P-ring formation protein FlgA